MTRNLLLYLLFSFSIFSAAMAQERVVSGTLTDETGEPIPGVNIQIKGTTTGTVSDIDGSYTIQAPIGATLIFSFIGYTSYEVVVDLNNSQAIGQPDKPTHTAVPTKKPYFKPGQNQRGVARLNKTSPGYMLRSGNRNIRGLPVSHSIANAYKIQYVSPKWATIRYGKTGNNGLYIVKDRMHPNTPFQINFTSALTVDKVYKLPALQNTYAQGRPLNGTEAWLGPETGEILSWGPKLANLEFDGNPYSYDVNGMLVAKGSGDGKKAHVYDPFSFFRTGITMDHFLNLHKTLGETTIDLAVQQKQQNHVVPHSHYYRNNFNLKISAPVLYRLQTDYLLSYSAAEGNLLQRGANMARIFSGIIRTPPSFDNANGLSTGKAIENKAAYLLANGMPRSASPGRIDNPYWLINTLPDQEQLKKLLATLHLRYAAGYAFSLNYNLGVDKQWSNNQFGAAPFSAGSEKGRLTDRNEGQTTLHSIITPSFRRDIGSFPFEMSVTYDLSYTKRALSRMDGFGFSTHQLNITNADSTSGLSLSKNRVGHEVLSAVKVGYRDILNLKLSNQSYFSSTIPKNKAFLPGAGINFIFTNIAPIRYGSFLSDGRLYAAYTESVKEAPLLYSNWHFNSTTQSLSDYLSYFEEQELHFTEGLLPEHHRKWAYGASFNLLNYRLDVTFAYSSTFTKQAIIPVLTHGSFRLANSADIQNKAYEVSLQYHTNNSPLQWSTKINFSRFTPIVKRIYSNEQRIPIAGFREVSANLVAGQPYGVIYGNTYLKNSAGKLIMGEDGFPLVDHEQKPIGNPNPDWVAGVENSLSWKCFDLNFVVDIRKGGDVWNGTRQALDYFGLSAYTGQAREVRNYIFDGVLDDGSINRQPVDFANPVNSLSGNRWVRYGITGVSAEAIEDASWIRLNEVKLSCQLPNLLSRMLPSSQVKLSLIGKNVLLLTRYSGVDPATSLFGYQTASGLDFFNMPAMRSYGISLNIKL